MNSNPKSISSTAKSQDDTLLPFACKSDLFAEPLRGDSRAETLLSDLLLQGNTVLDGLDPARCVLTAPTAQARVMRPFADDVLAGQVRCDKSLEGSNGARCNHG